SEGFRTPERPYGDLSRLRVHGGFPSQGENRNRGGRRPGGLRGGSDRQEREHRQDRRRQGLHLHGGGSHPHPHRRNRLLRGGRELKANFFRKTRSSRGGGRVFLCPGGAGADAL